MVGSISAYANGWGNSGGECQSMNRNSVYLGDAKRNLVKTKNTTKQK